MDPFIVPDSKSKSSTLCVNPFVKDSTEGISTLGQMTSYVTSHLGSQFRTHTFFILIVHDYARIIRWDRGGAVVTAPIHFNEEPYLFDFFLRYNYAESHIRGSDSSVRAPTTEELRAATSLSMSFATLVRTKERQKAFWSFLSHGMVQTEISPTLTATSSKPPLQQFPPQLDVRLEHSSPMTFAA